MHLPSFAPLLVSAPDPENAPGAMVARVARQIFASPSELDLSNALLAVLAGIVLQVLAYWIAAKVVVGNEKGTLARAAYLWLLILLLGIGAAVVLVLGLATVAASQPPVLLAVAAGGLALLLFLVSLLLVAKVFETGLLRALGILLLAGILTLAGQTAFDRLLSRPSVVRWAPVQRLLTASPADRERRLKHLLAGDPLAQIENDLDRLSMLEERRKPFSERQQGLRTVFASLEAQRKRLKADDAPGLADYEVLRQRYEELIKVMRADYAASLAPPAAR